METNGTRYLSFKDNTTPVILSTYNYSVFKPRSGLLNPQTVTLEFWGVSQLQEHFVAFTDGSLYLRQLTKLPNSSFSFALTQDTDADHADIYAVKDQLFRLKPTNNSVSYEVVNTDTFYRGYWKIVILGLEKGMTILFTKITASTAISK